MINDKNYQRYLIIKGKLNFVYKGIQYDKVLSLDIANNIFKHDKPRIKEILKGFFFSLDMAPFIKACAAKEKILIYTADRNDHKFLIEQTIANISSIESIQLNFNKKICIKPIKILVAFFYTYKSLRKIESLSGIFFYKNIHNQLFSIFNSKTRKEINLISFSSAFSIENLLCQFFNLNNCPTFSLSHGFFVPYKKFIPIDIINGENIVSHKILVWGSSSVEDLYHNYNFPKERVMVAGNPKYPYKTINIKQTFKNCIVLLGRIIYHESNLEIVEIIKETIINNPTIKFDVKLHPTLNIELYKEICNGTGIHVLEENKTLFTIFKENEYDFAIVNNSTAYYEAMYAGMICFRYKKSENEDFKGLNDKFTDAASLHNSIHYFMDIDNQKLNNEVESLLSATLGMGINNYKQILD